jgi:hypothetical protein
LKSGPEVVKSGPEVAKPGPEVAKFGLEQARSSPEMVTSKPEMEKFGPEMVKSGPEIAKSGPEVAKSGPEVDCLKRILCEMNSVVSGRTGGGADLARMLSEFGTFALLQNQNVLAPTESLLRAARTGRFLAAPGSCRRIYNSCDSWERITSEAELLWLQNRK